MLVRWHDEKCKFKYGIEKLEKVKKVICEHCNRVIIAYTYKRYHGDKCKYKHQQLEGNQD